MLEALGKSCGLPRGPLYRLHVRLNMRPFLSPKVGRLLEDQRSDPGGPVKAPLFEKCKFR